MADAILTTADAVILRQVKSWAGVSADMAVKLEALAQVLDAQAARGGDDDRQSYLDGSVKLAALATSFPEPVRTAMSTMAAAWADQAVRLTAPVAPGVVRNVAGSVTAGSVILTWDAPVSNGGSPILRYSITRTGGAGVETIDATTTATMTGLTAGSAYTFTVAAVNAVGTGPAASTPPIVIPAGTATVDLQPMAIYVDPPAPKAGDSVTISVDVKNNGTTAVVTGVNPQVDGIGVAFLVGGNYVAWHSPVAGTTINPGQTVRLTANGGPVGSALWIPATAGSYTVRAWVDDVGRIPQSNNANDTLDRTVTVASAGVGANWFAAAWGGYRDHGSQQLLDFEAATAPIHYVSIMQDYTSAQGSGSAMWETFAATAAEVAPYGPPWTPNNIGNKTFVLQWGGAWMGQNLTTAYTDASHIAAIQYGYSRLVASGLPPGKLIVRLMHEWEKDFYPWSLEVGGNTPTKFHDQWMRLHDAWVAADVNGLIDGFELCGYANSGSIPNRGVVLDSLVGVSDLKYIGTDIYLQYPLSTYQADVQYYIDYCAAHSKRFAVSEFGSMTTATGGLGDNLSEFNAMMALFDAMAVKPHHINWFESQQGGDHLIEHVPNIQAAVLARLRA